MLIRGGQCSRKDLGVSRASPKCSFGPVAFRFGRSFHSLRRKKLQAMTLLFH